MHYILALPSKLKRCSVLKTSTNMRRFFSGIHDWASWYGTKNWLHSTHWQNTKKKRQLAFSTSRCFAFMTWLNCCWPELICGGLGLRVCSLNVAFMFATVFATVRSRSQPSEWGPYGRAYGKFCRRGHFGGFKCRVASFRGRRGTSWHLDVFRNVSKVVLCGTRNTFATFSQDKLQFSWQAQRFGRVQLHLAWQAQHFRSVVLRVFCESHCQGCVKWRQGANSVAGVAVCEMWWKLTEALHETSILK